VWGVEIWGARAVMVSCDQLLERAKEFNAKALEYHVNNRVQLFVINAATSAELLGKAYLVNYHPCLIVDNDFDSLLHICGESKHSRKSLDYIKTISATITLKRCQQLIIRLSAFLKDIELLINLRNGIVHLGVYDKALGEKLLVPYVKYSSALLEELGIQRDDYFERFAELVDVSIQESINTIMLNVQQMIAKARIDYENRFKMHTNEEREVIIAAIINSYSLMKDYDELVECPACFNKAKISGSTELVDWTEVEIDGRKQPYPVVELFAELLKCNVCGLSLDDYEELEAAGVMTSIPIEDVDPEDYYRYRDDYYPDF